MPKHESQSQLKRLKSALRDSGISRDQKSNGPRKSRNDREKELSKIRDRFNPYEVQVNKSKFAVGGRKLKGTEGRPGASASTAEKMRHETMGKERERKGRVGGVLDRRFGEGRADLTPEQIQLERYTRERQKSKKRNNFSLEGEDDEELGLTHLGQSLADMDDFGPAPVSEDEDMGAEMVSRTNFGGFEEELEEDEIIGEDGQKRKKTKAEVMQEIIAKSKQGRSDRQRQAEEDDEAREALDADLEDLQALLHESQSAKPNAQDGVNPDRMKAIHEDSAYDKAVKEMIYDRRAQASERTKTEEELIEEEAKRLHEQEDARMRRMRGEEIVETQGTKRKRAAQGDDLSDDFQSDSGSDDASDEDAGFGIGVNARASAQAADQSASDSGEDVDSDSSESPNSATGKIVDFANEYEIEADEESGAIPFVSEEDDEDEDDDADNDEDDEDDEDDEELPSEELIEAAKAELARRQAASPKSILKQLVPKAIVERPSELKFTYPCPSSMDELLSILHPLSDADKQIALHRIRVLHHPRLNPANNDKLSKLLTLLIEYVLVEEPSPLLSGYCVGQIQELSQKYWEPSVSKFLEILEAVRQKMYKNMTKSWTQMELKFFSLIGQVWSTSDAYHKVATPALLVACQYLTQNSASGKRDLATKVVLCTLLHHWIRDSKRYLPEVMSSLRDILTSCRATAEAKPLDISNLKAATESDIALAASKLVMQFASSYLSMPAYVELFSPFVKLIKEPELLMKSLENAKNLHRPLTLQTHRPIPLALAIPKFEENYNVDKRSYDRNSDRQADAKLKKEIHDAKRSAVRVLRRDAGYEARQAKKRQNERDGAYKDKVGKLENKLRQKEL